MLNSSADQLWSRLKLYKNSNTKISLCVAVCLGKQNIVNGFPLCIFLELVGYIHPLIICKSTKFQLKKLFLKTVWMFHFVCNK